MQNIILLFIYLLLIAVNHFRYKFLLSGNAGEMILYFANVVFLTHLPYHLLSPQSSV